MVIGIHVDDFLIGLADGALGEEWTSEIKSLCRWGSWEIWESEFAGIRVGQHRDFSITVDLEDYTNKFITEASITRERSRKRQESLTAQELSMLRGVLGTASWRAQRMSTQFAADVSLLLSVTAHPVVQDLLEANKLVRDIRRSSAQSLHFHSFNETPWQQLVFASWADASDRPYPDGSRTGGYVMTLATEKLCGHGQEDDVKVMAGRSFELLRKIAGSNNGETQALAFADESLWLARLAWSEMHGASMRRWHLDETVRQLNGMSESPQLRLRSSRTGEEARGIKEQCAVSDARIHCVNTSTMLADSLTKPGYPARAVMESFLVKSKRSILFNDDEVNDINPSTNRVAFDTLLQDEPLSEDVRGTCE